MPYRAPARPVRFDPPPPPPRRPSRVIAGAETIALSGAGMLAGAAVMALLFVILTVGGQAAFELHSRRAEVVLRALSLVAGMFVGGTIIAGFARRAVAQAVLSGLLFALVMGGWQLWWKHAGGGGTSVLMAALVLGVSAAAFGARSARRPPA